MSGAFPARSTDLEFYTIVITISIIRLAGKGPSGFLVDVVDVVVVVVVATGCDAMRSAKHFVQKIAARTVVRWTERRDLLRRLCLSAGTWR